jgi:hypothetical protein
MGYPYGSAADTWIYPKVLVSTLLRSADPSNNPIYKAAGNGRITAFSALMAYVLIFAWIEA